MGNQKKLVSYIDRAQTVYQIIEAEKSSGRPPTDAEIIKLNKRFTRAFYCGLRDDIRSIIEKRNDLSPSEMYELGETADQELKARRESQQTYTCRLSRDEFIAPQPASKSRMEGSKKRLPPIGFVRAI